MAKRVGFSGQHLTLTIIAKYHADLDASLRLYYTDGHPTFLARFFAYTPPQVASELGERIAELELSSAMTVLAALEAAFRVDYLQRCYLRKRDELSRAFRLIHKQREAQGSRASLEDELLKCWQTHSTVSSRLVSDLAGVFKLRHWLAHGRYWIPKLARKYDFYGIHSLADEVFKSFPFIGV